MLAIRRINSIYLNMKDFSYYERQLLACLPHRFRDSVNGSIQSFEQSRSLLQIYKRAVESWPTNIEKRQVALAAFGSLGRLDGSTLTSDYDVLHLYAGVADDECFKVIREAIKKLLQNNEALPFESRDRIANETLDFHRCPAYQILSVEELLGDTKQIQALQLLTESRTVLGEDMVFDIRERVLRKHGYSDNEFEVNYSPLREGLLQLNTSYRKEVMGRLAKENRTLLNRKVLKLFTLREFFYLATLFALVEAALAGCKRRGSVSETLRILSAPCILKLAASGNPTGPLSQLIYGHSVEVAAEVTRITSRHIKNLLLEPDSAIDEESGETSGVATSAKENDFSSNFRTLALAPLAKYDILLRRLHDPEFLVLIDRFRPDITTWLGHKEFNAMLSLRRQLIQFTVSLAYCLNEVLQYINKSSPSPALDDAIKTLEVIIDYRLDAEPNKTV